MRDVSRSSIPSAGRPVSNNWHRSVFRACSDKALTCRQWHHIREDSGQDPELPKDVIHSVPGVHVEDAQPELAPGGDGNRAAPGRDQLASSPRVGVSSGDSYEQFQFRVKELINEPRIRRDT